MAAAHDHLRQHYKQHGGHLLHLSLIRMLRERLGSLVRRSPLRTFWTQGHCAVNANKEGTCTTDSCLRERGLPTMRLALVITRLPRLLMLELAPPACRGPI